ncbi:hypothetical protein SSP531S_58100 [Streptomyces spongiicola]|uniref:Uncharacterized protein n=1 Tax=Streptomyces spongiicola TaxID=1690221 RepID=A0A388T716_9ACTN|nr:hypothetical protein SSP531S_58100 [Streptomyces spongiicola]
MAADESGCTPGKITAALSPARTCTAALVMATLMATYAFRPAPCSRRGASGTTLSIATRERHAEAQTQPGSVQHVDKPRVVRHMLKAFGGITEQGAPRTRSPKPWRAAIHRE